VDNRVNNHVQIDTNASAGAVERWNACFLRASGQSEPEEGAPIVMIARPSGEQAGPRAS
jgi:hypothetical protein